MKSVEMYKKIKGGEKRKKELSESILHNQEKFKKLNQQKQEESILRNFL